jgi:hypothetical protein
MQKASAMSGSPLNSKQADHIYKLLGCKKCQLTYFHLTAKALNTNVDTVGINDTHRRMMALQF